MGETIAVSNFMIYTLGLVVFFVYLWGGFVFYKKYQGKYSLSRAIAIKI